MLCCCGVSPVTGACCEGQTGGVGICNVRTELECQDASGDWQGPNTTCDPNPCPVTVGACCFPDGSCTTTIPARCTALGGDFQGLGTTCDPNPCEQPSGACCFPDGSCAVTDPITCAQLNGDYQGNGSTCAGVECPPIYCRYCTNAVAPASRMEITITGVQTDPPDPFNFGPLILPLINGTHLEQEVPGGGLVRTIGSCTYQIFQISTGPAPFYGFSIQGQFLSGGRIRFFISYSELIGGVGGGGTDEFLIDPPGNTINCTDGVYNFSGANFVQGTPRSEPFDPPPLREWIPDYSGMTGTWRFLP